MEPKVGETWRDKDARMDGRLVKILDANGTWVQYGQEVKGRIPRKVRSATARFVKAFEKV